MSAQIRRESGNGGDEVVMKLKDIELSLSLPGTKTTTSRTKRGFSDDTALELHLGTSSSSSSSSSTTTTTHHDNQSPNNNQLFFSSKPPPSKAQVVGWPPVRANRKNNAMKNSCCCKYVKVAVDGAPYLRKVDLEMYDSYHHLLTALESMFSCLTIPGCNDYWNERKLMEGAGNGSEYMPTYEDKDGDWMLVGDVPWKMFVESCKRIRLMIKSEATVGLGASMASKSTGSS